MGIIFSGSRFTDADWAGDVLMRRSTTGIAGDSRNVLHVEQISGDVRGDANKDVVSGVL